MKRIIGSVALAIGFFAGRAAIAAEQTVTLDVANMTCASCPYIVKKSLTAIPGVTKVSVSFEDKSATVTFDDQKASTNALIAATTGAGYPAKLASTAGVKIQ